MSTTETWLIVAAILALASTVCHLLAAPPPVARIAPALLAAAVGSIAVALVLAFP